MARRTPDSDICLILEGTYPYVSGGVSTWVHQIINAFPEWRFSIFFLGAQKDPKATYKYELPTNVTCVEEVYLFQDDGFRVSFGRPGGAAWTAFYANLRRLFLTPPSGDEHDFQMLRGILDLISHNPRMSFETFWSHRESWEVLREVYDRYADDESFLDYFWTCKFLVQPLWRLAQGMAKLPSAKVYHTACTGYAGIAAALAGAKTDRPVMLTEHGIYLRERIADICRSRWIPDPPISLPGLDQPLSSLRRLWIGFFDVIGRMCYSQSSDIVSLFERNAAAQRHFGAVAEKITIIPNGIQTESFKGLNAARLERRAKSTNEKPVVGFLGRVVSIKDVKTLLRTAARVRQSLPGVQFLIAGPQEEEPEYFAECWDLTAQLSLNECVHYLGPKNRNDFLPQLDLMILTSVSEGLPFVVLESLAAGVPVVATDVGACAEILLGATGEEPHCGPAGLIAEVGSADQLANACLELLTNAPLLEQFSANGRRRVELFYHENRVLGDYRKLYQALMDQMGSGDT
ncbi:MAG: GT4 family glycosyltransferase PelF [Verrucomicrobiales bacterium]|nr:GT4 family glycosyltransferase PelF [Verrucomicrobiales bacterium]MCP5558155.1 GT4 family glycosyltransferase PelF [Verrucomicrobiaceae bacterium]